MTEREHESGEEQIDESGNPTQRQMDGDEQGPAAPAPEEGDEREGWEETNDDPAQGEQGQESV